MVSASHGPLISLSLLIAGLFGFRLAPDSGDEEALANNVLEGLQLEAASPLQSLRMTTEDAELIKSAMGDSVAGKESLVAFHGKVKHEDEESEAWIARSRFEIDDKAQFALLAIDATGSFLAAAVTDERGEPIEEWKHSLESFKFYEVPVLEGAHPRSHLAKLREELAKKGSGDQGALVLGLLDVLHHMQSQASAFNLPREGRVLGAAETADKMGEDYAALATLADAVSSVLGSTREDFVRLANDSQAAAEDMARATRAGDRDGRRAGRKRLFQNCKSCHEMPIPGSDFTLKEAFAEKRKEHSIGDGYYAVGHDVRLTHHDRNRLQKMADAMRQAALVIDAKRSAHTPEDPK